MITTALALISLIFIPYAFGKFSYFIISKDVNEKCESKIAKSFRITWSLGFIMLAFVCIIIGAILSFMWLLHILLS